MYTSLKSFVKAIEQRIPKHVRQVAELRLMWVDVVGESMAKRSQVAKCVYVPKMQDNQPTGQYYKRLLIWVDDSATKMAMTELTAEFLERIPQRYHIHSLDIRLMSSKKILELPTKTIKREKPQLLVSESEKEHIKKRLIKMNISDDLYEALFEFLCICKNQQHKGHV
ncbi:MAG: DciA family protein [Brevinema sp.]